MPDAMPDATPDTTQEKPPSKDVGRYVDVWRCVAGSLFALAFVATVAALIFASGDKTALTAVIIVLVGALILIAVLPNLHEFTIGPKGVEAKLGLLESAVREQGAQVNTLNDAVKRIEEHLIFEPSPALTPEVEQGLNAAFSPYSAYLRQLGYKPQVANITVRVEEPKGASYSYIDESHSKFVMTSDVAADPDSALREYTNHVLLSILGDNDERSIAYTELLSGLAYYFPCSFNNRPFFAPIIAKQVGRPYLVNLTNSATFGRLRSAVHYSSELQGDVWAAAFWELRQQFGQLPTDSLLFSTWSQLQPADRHLSRLTLARRLLQIAASVDSGNPARQLQALLEQRGLKV